MHRCPFDILNDVRPAKLLEGISHRREEIGVSFGVVHLLQVAESLARRTRVNHIELMAMLFEECKGIGAMESATGISWLWFYIDTEDTETGESVPVGCPSGT